MTEGEREREGVMREYSTTFLSVGLATINLTHRMTKSFKILSTR